MAGILKSIGHRLPGYQTGGEIIDESHRPSGVLKDTPELRAALSQFDSRSWDELNLQPGEGFGRTSLPNQSETPKYSSGHTYGWDFSSGIPQLREGLSTPPSYGMGINQNYRPVQIGATPSGIDHSAGYRQQVISGNENAPAHLSGANYSSPTEATAWITNAAKAGYYGTVQDAAEQARQGNQKAISALQNFLGSGQAGGTQTELPGLLGVAQNAITNYTGGTGDSTVPQNITDAVAALDAANALHSDDNSSGYVGNTVQQQQNISDAAATSTYGDWSTWSDDNNDSNDNNGGFDSGGVGVGGDSSFHGGT